MAQAKLDTPITREVMEVTLNKAPFGKAFKKEAGAVTAAVHGLSDEQKMEMKTQLESGPYKVTFHTLTTNTFPHPIRDPVPFRLHPWRPVPIP